MYHKVFLESPTVWWVDADNFYRQMCELKYKTIVYLDDYDPDNPNHVVITFDGCYKNVLEYAVPILKKFSYPFEVFITSDYLGKDNSFDTGEPPAEFVSFDDLKTLIDSGARVQWHTKSHRNLKDVEDANIIQDELSIPDYLIGLDNKSFRWFAYPNGDWNETIVNEVKKRFAGALSCNQGNDKDIYRLNRITVTNKSSFKKATICVIIASYNYGQFLVEAVESVLRQTRPADEILIVDDCSSDNTAEIGMAYQREYPYIKFHRNEKNLGIVNNFNQAVSMTSSDYICFLGADNRFVSNYIEKTAEVLDSSDDIAIAYTDFALFGQRARLIYENYEDYRKGEIIDNHFYIIRFPEFDLKELKKGNYIHGSSMYKRKAFNDVGGYKAKKNTPEDYNLFLRMAEAGWKAKRIPLPLLEYRQHSKDQANIVLSSYAELNFYKSHYQKLCEEISKLEKGEWSYLQVFLPHESGYSEDKSIRKEYTLSGETVTMEIETETDLNGSLRIDPVALPAYVEIDSIQLYEYDLQTKKEIKTLEYTSSSDFSGLTTSDNIVLLSKDESYRFICLDSDPQIFLGHYDSCGKGKAFKIQIVIRAISVKSKEFLTIIQNQVIELRNSKEKLEHTCIMLDNKVMENENLAIVLNEKDKEITQYKESELEHKKRVEELGSDYNKRIEELESDYNKRIEELESDYNKRIEELESDYNKRIEELESEYKKRIDELSNKLNSIYNSRGYKLLLKYYKAKSWLLRKKK